MRINEVTDNIDNLVDEFKKKNTKYIEQGCRRNYCEVPAIKFVSFAKQRGYNVEKVYGEFLIDTPEYHFDDFTQQEKASMKMQYLDPHKREDRIKFAKKHNLDDELKKVPHYWNEYKGQIIDLTGYAQFVETGLAADLNTSRYIK